MKTNRVILSITLAATLALIQPGASRAGVGDGIVEAHKQAEASPARAGDLTSVYKSCEKVRVISKETYDKDPSKWSQEVKNCGGNLQVGLDVGFFKGTLKETTDAMSLTELIAEKHKGYLAANIDYLGVLQACFSSGKVPDKMVSCENIRKKVRAAVEAKVPEARLELALSKGENRDFPVRYKDAKDQNGNINTFAEGFSGWLSYAVGGHELSKGESAKAVAARLADMKALDAEFAKAKASRDQTKKNLPGGGSSMGSDSDYERLWYENHLKQKTQEHQAKYRAIIHDQMPILNYLPTTKNWKDGKPSWTDAELGQAIAKVSENASKEKAITEKALSHKTLEFSRLYGKVKVKGPNGKEYENTELSLERFQKSVLKGERDLLDYIAFTPLVEEVLKEHPELCGTATAMSQHLANKQMQNALGIGGGVAVVFLPLGFIGGAGSATAVAGGGAVAGSATIATVAAGVALGAGFLANSITELDRTQQSVLVTTGTSDQEKKVQDPKVIEEKESAVVWDIVSQPLNFIGAGAAMGAGQKFVSNALMRGGLREAGVSKELAGDMVKLANNANPEIRAAAKAKIDEFVGKAAQAEKGITGGRVFNAEENEIIARAAKRGLLGSPNKPNVEPIEELGRYAQFLKGEEQKLFYKRTLDLLEKVNPAVKADAKTKGTAMKTIMELSALGYSDEKEIVKILNAAEWQGQPLDGLRAVAKKARIYAKPEAGETIEQARSRAFVKGLEESGVPQESRLGMCVCASMCKAAGRAALEVPGVPSISIASSYRACVKDNALF